MQNQIRSIGTFSLREALKLDAINGTMTAVATVLAAHDRRIPSQAHLWPAKDEADAELRRAVAYRHGCVFVDSEYLVGPEGAIDLVRCEQSYAFYFASIWCHAQASKKLTRDELSHVTLRVAQVVAARAAAMFGATASKMRIVTDAFSEMGVEARLPSLEPVEPHGKREASVGAAVIACINAACDAIDEKPDAAEPNPASDATKARAPYLRLVK